MSPAVVRQTSPDALQAAAAETFKISYTHSTALGLTDRRLGGGGGAGEPSNVLAHPGPTVGVE